MNREEALPVVRDMAARGSTKSAVCAAVGCSRPTLNAWLRDAAPPVKWSRVLKGRPPVARKSAPVKSAPPPPVQIPDTLGGQLKASMERAARIVADPNSTPAEVKVAVEAQGRALANYERGRASASAAPPGPQATREVPESDADIERWLRQQAVANDDVGAMVKAVEVRVKRRVNIGDAVRAEVDRLERVALPPVCEACGARINYGDVS